MKDYLKPGHRSCDPVVFVDEVAEAAVMGRRIGLIEQAERLNRQSTKIIIVAAVISVLNVILIAWRLVA